MPASTPIGFLLAFILELLGCFPIFERWKDRKKHKPLHDPHDDLGSYRPTITTPISELEKRQLP